MWSKVCAYVRKYNLLDANSLYLIALSGGADSVALLLLLREAGFRVHAAHCNFHLRGEESDGDERFCVELCERLGIELHRAHFDTRTYAELHKVSIEMAARELRYRWFEQLCEDVGAAAVCVAHHRDDSVETVLLNLVRGTGLRGLTGIQPRSELEVARWQNQREQEQTEGGCWQNQQQQERERRVLTILRPLLCVSRQEIEAFLAEKGQKYVTDSTNLETDVQRNKVRLEVLPLLKTLNPAVTENIQRTAEHLSEGQRILDAISNRYKYSKTLEISEFKKYGSSEYFVFEWAKNYGFNGKQIGQVMTAETGSVFTSATGFDLLVDRGRLIVEPALKPLKNVCIPEEGTYVLGGFGNQNAENTGKRASERTTIRVQKRAVYVSKDPWVATLDAQKVAFPLTLRRVVEGDWMQPFGMMGRKLLSDLMTDRKMTVFEKRRQLVAVDAQGLIAWALGLRTDARVAVSADTQEVLELRFEGSNP